MKAVHVPKYNDDYGIDRKWHDQYKYEKKQRRDRERPECMSKDMEDVRLL